MESVTGRVCALQLTAKAKKAEADAIKIEKEIKA